MQYLPDELAHALDPVYLQRGRGYWRQGRVIGLERRGDQVVAQVAGSGDQIYTCEILLSRNTRGQLRVDGVCECPVGYNCKHVAAALLAAAQRPQVAADPARDPLLHSWLAELDHARSDPERYPEDVRERLLYVLNLREYPTGARIVTVDPQRVRLLVSGKYGTPTPYRNSSGQARFLRPSDQNLLRQLAAMSGYDFQLKGDWGVRLLGDMLATGRCHWRDTARPPLSLGPVREGRFEWRTNDAGAQVLHLDPGGEALVLPLMPPWYLDESSGLCGPIQTGLPARLAGTLCNAPPIPMEAAEALIPRLEGLPLPPVPQLRRERRERTAPVPWLRLSSRKLESFDPSMVQLYLQRLRAGLPTEWLDEAQLGFDYQGLRVEAGDRTDPLRKREGDTLLEFPRRWKLEDAYRQKLLDAGFEPLAQRASLGLANEQAWLEFVIDRLPALRTEGWRIEMAPDFRFRVAQASEWYAEVEEGGSDWFALNLGVEVDGKRINLLPVLARLLHQLPPSGRKTLREMPEQMPVLLPLDDGQLLPVPAGRIRPMLETLLELYDPRSLDQAGRLRLSRLRSPALSELESGGDLTWAGGAELRALGEKLKDFQGIRRVQPPRGLRASLREYQCHGLDWLQFLREHGLSGVLADDMGLGKTLQTLAHLLLEKESGRADRPSLVVAPTSLITNWRREAARFAPELSVLTLHGPQRAAEFEAIPRHDLVLTSYPLLHRDIEALMAHGFHLLVLDEAQHIKNPRSRAAEAASRLGARQRLCLSGTPLENNLSELWSLFNFLMPGLLGERERFNRLFRTPIERQGDQERQDQLRKRVGPFLLRRTKEAVAAELPPKTELVRSVSLEGAQRDLYETVRLAMHERIREEVARKGWERSHIVILDALLKLRQICCDPRLVKLEGARSVKSSAKLELLMELLPQLLGEGRRVLLFSQFTEMLALIEKALDKEKIPYVKLTGRTQDRATPVDRFQAGQVPLFLISLKAGGTGLNLTAADTVIHYDPWWNPAVERQATDRAHRIGQDKPVFVYKLICEGTVEERMVELQARKAALSEAVLSGAASAGGLAAEDLEVLFEPL